MGKRIDAETRAAMVRAYCEDDSTTYSSVAKKFGVSFDTARRIITNELQTVPGVKPDRRAAEPENPWMQHITPLHKHKQELEDVIEHKQAELDAARHEYRDFLATLKQLMEDRA